MPSPVVLG